MRKVDTSAYSAQIPKTRVKPEKVNLGNLPPIRKSPHRRTISRTSTSDKKIAKPSRSTHERQHPKPNISQEVVQKVKAMEEGQMRYDEAILKTVMKEVQPFGNSPCLYRLTQSEKSRLTQLTFQLKSEGYKISETDIVRIALNYILEDNESTVTGGVVRRIVEILDR